MDAAHIHVASYALDPDEEYGCEYDWAVACFGDERRAIEHLRHQVRRRQEAYVERCEATTPEQRERGAACCAWCSAAWLVGSALHAVDTGDAAYKLTTRGTCAWPNTAADQPRRVNELKEN